VRCLQPESACAGRPLTFQPLVGRGLPTDPTLDRGGVFATMTRDLRELLCWSEGRDPDPSAVIFDSSTQQSTLESGLRAVDDGYRRKRCSKVHLAVDTLRQLLALHVTPAMTRIATRSPSWRRPCRRRRDRRLRWPTSIRATPARPHATQPPSTASNSWSSSSRTPNAARPPAKTVGQGAIVRLGHPIPVPRQRLRAVARDGRRRLLPRFRLPESPTPVPSRSPKSLTGSRRRRSEG
jgi:hypothetical protein